MTNNIYESSFKKTMTKIGFAMLIFLGLFNVLFMMLDFVFNNIKESLLSNVFYELIYALLYLASFIIPAIILNLMMGKEKSPIMLEKKLPLDIAAYIFAAISVILTISYVNFTIVDIFNYSEYSSEVIWGNDPLSNHEIVLMFITSAIAPAFAEEFLFRGAILSALKPYGKMTSIFISAILFAFMHQNIEQLLYTFAGGIVLAWVVYETGSIWSSILIHLFNNLLSVVISPIYDRLSESLSYLVVLIIEISIFVLGIASAIYLFIRKLNTVKEKKAVASAVGIYGVPSERFGIDDSRIAERKIPAGKVIKHFFSPTVIVFLAISVLTMIILILDSFMYNAGAL